MNFRRFLFLDTSEIHGISRNKGVQFETIFKNSEIGLSNRCNYLIICILLHHFALQNSIYFE